MPIFAGRSGSGSDNYFGTGLWSNFKAVPMPGGHCEGALESIVEVPGARCVRSSFWPRENAVRKSTWVMDGKNVPQPDISLRIDPQCGGQSHDVGEYYAGAADLIVDVPRPRSRT